MALNQEVRIPAERFSGRSRWDAIVVGCGVMGAAASYNLARRGLRVLNIERFGVNHEFGSSHGRTRIIRLAYYEDPRYVPLLRRAFDSWREAESRSGKKLLRMTGGLMVGRPQGELVTGVLRSAKSQGIRYEFLSSAEAETRFEAFTLGEGYAAVYEETAGVLFAEECVRAFVGLGSEAGCDFRFSEQVRAWRGTPGGVEVETSSGTQTAAKLVLCAGPWNGGLLRGLIPLQVERQAPLWFSSEGLDCFAPPKMPVFILEEDRGVFYYGIPELGHGVKVARSHGGEPTDPDRVRREVTEEEDIRHVKEFVSRRLRRLGRVPIASTTCLYTNTPDFNFAVGLHPADGNVVIMSPCSGHGFKFASVLGEVAADLVTEKSTPYDLAFLDPARFAPVQTRGP